LLFLFLASFSSSSWVLPWELSFFQS
jgi:hypothetical protein